MSDAGSSTSRPLACPSCARSYPLDVRFCPDCNMPLVYAGALGADQPITDEHERARKIKPQFAEGELVRVAGARNQAEAEFIQGLLLEEGVPSILRRTRGFDVPDFLAAGPRDIMVPAAGAATAREILLEADVVAPGTAESVTSPARLLAGLLVGVVLVALVLWMGSELIG